MDWLARLRRSPWRNRVMVTTSAFVAGWGAGDGPFSIFVLYGGLVLLGVAHWIVEDHAAQLVLESERQAAARAARRSES